MIHAYSFPTEIRVGAGARKLLPEKLKSLGLARPLLVTDRGVAAQPFLEEVAQLAGGIPVFSDMGGNPCESHVRGALAAYRAANADSIVAVGGGAPMDVAKAVAVLARNDGALFDFAIDANPPRIIEGPLPPILALPTTAGTGSEVGRSTVISEDDTHRKRILFSPGLLPRAVFADPELLVGLPRPLTAATGMDALTHCVEAFLTVAEKNPLCDGIALEGLRLCAKYLARSCDAPEDLEAREGMLDAALMGAVAFQKGLGANHSCAHALSTVADLHHGLANGVMLPFVLRFNYDARPDAFARLAAAVDAPGGDFIAWVEALRAKIGIPAGLATLGVSSDQTARLARIAAADVCTPLNPKPIAEADFKRLFDEALA
ncbi:MAG: alcohol dehydrogenase [Elusimicrobia bacterium CG_4_9_14_3_um_filter_62_55]|nr:MAG: alcohol dehydrogenase [Elusimicrobia bacterium CG22_combo_CG10-13_8_21_14_all_63_91]PJA17819.1 MAG: alcohol dehydrogenase [Elusimicrobia bacterium CG_4_10_14_0_2_um_filter_63_34]PJB24637.1 MAG: alcohol dehydrogenase [Elusimicrobia bacterium CG_4_9_14_3_um_filter_62_55]